MEYEEFVVRYSEAYRILQDKTAGGVEPTAVEETKVVYRRYEMIRCDSYQRNLTWVNMRVSRWVLWRERGMLPVRGFPLTQKGKQTKGTGNYRRSQICRRRSV